MPLLYVNLDSVIQVKKIGFLCGLQVAITHVKAGTKEKSPKCSAQWQPGEEKSVTTSRQLV